jgi:ADP-heptose:LPS heptosyltransferase
MNSSSPRTDYLLVRLHSLGDLVLAAPAAAAAASRGSAAFLTRRALIPVVERFAFGVVPLACDPGLAPLLKAASEIRAGAVADLQNNLATRLAFPGAGRFSVNRRLRRSILSLGSSRGGMPYRAEEFLKAAGLAGDPVPRLDRRGFPREDEFSVGLVVGGRWPMKSLPEGVAAELARLYCDRDRAAVFLIGDTGDHPAGERIRTACGGRRVSNLCGEGGTGTLLSRLEAMNLVVSPDSGPAHAARALGVRTLVVFTSTSPELGFWRNSPGETFMVSGVPCRPCHRHGGRRCPLATEACRRRLVPGEIYATSRRGMD